MVPEITDFDSRIAYYRFPKATKELLLETSHVL